MATIAERIECAKAFANRENTQVATGSRIVVCTSLALQTKMTLVT